MSNKQHKEVYSEDLKGLEEIKEIESTKDVIVKSINESVKEIDKHILNILRNKCNPPIKGKVTIKALEEANIKIVCQNELSICWYWVEQNDMVVGRMIRINYQLKKF